MEDLTTDLRGRGHLGASLKSKGHRHSERAQIHHFSGV